jgi:DNA-directed RNA polymerase specialized sigma24 family protein
VRMRIRGATGGGTGGVSGRVGAVATGMIGRMDRHGGAFEAFYRDAWADAVRWAIGLTGSRAAAEDIAQSAFAAVADRFDRLDNPAGYLRRTVVNLARSEHRTATRRQRRESRMGTDRALGLVADVPFDGGTELLRRVGGLPYDQRAALVLRYWADWDEASIADALGCRPTTVRSHVKRALDTLRSLDPGSLR